MKTIHLIIAVNINSALLCAQQASVNPEPDTVKKTTLDYIKAQFTAIGNSANIFHSLYEGEKISGNSPGPEGGYLFKFHIDINQDGKDELFLSSSFANMEHQRWLVCRVYSLDEQGNYYLSGKDVCMRGDGYTRNSQPGKSQIQFFFKFDKERKTLFNVYSLNGENNIVAEKKVFSDREFENIFDNNKQKINSTLQIGAEQELKIEKVSLAEYLRDPNVKWRDYNSQLSPMDQNVDDSENDACSKGANFTLYEALTLLKMPIPPGMEKHYGISTPAP